jgi:hypothetical protein
MRRTTIVGLAALLVLGAAAQAQVFRAGARDVVEILKQFDRNGDGWLNTAERSVAREFAVSTVSGRGGGRDRGAGTPARGQTVEPSSVKTYPSAPFYDESVLRTLFIVFENDGWERELEDFRYTDVDVPAALTVDGKTYRDVGVHFRGSSSYFGIPTGFKRSLNLSLDMVHKQDVGGYRTLNLLNSNQDPALMRAVLFMRIAREYIPAPKANFVRVVINGENWGVYQNLQQPNKEFVSEAFNDSGGGRWKAPPAANGASGLAYLGEDVSAYRRVYEIKSKDDPKQWEALVELCRVLNEPPANGLADLERILDIDGALRFLAVDNVLANNDGYTARAGDYNIYRDSRGKFHILPHDANESFWMGNGGGNAAGGRVPASSALDPLSSINDPTKPLRSRLLAVPALREKYLGYVRDIASRWLDAKTLGPIVEGYKALIDAEVRADTRKLDSYDAFLAGTTGSGRSLMTFAASRREFLLGR